MADGPMRIRMIGDRLVSVDGHQVVTWADGTEHDFDDVHARSMIAAGFAEAVVDEHEDDAAADPDEQPDAEPSERKVITPKRRKGR